MRVTNGMIINNTLNGLNNNMSSLNKLYAQMSTGKKIQMPSDDPIIAGRALKLKTTVLETTQYEKNTKEATSWMEITEAALGNVTEILKSIRTKCNNAANDTLTEADRAVLKEDIAQLMKQIAQEANGTYNGRYIFSGYKTNESVMLTKDTTLSENVSIAANMTVASGSEIAQGSTMTVGSKLADGTVLGSGTTLSEGMTLGVGTVLSETDALALGLPVDPAATSYTLKAEHTIPVGGHKLQQQAVLHGDSTVGTKVAEGTDLKGQTLPEGSVIGKGTVLSVADATALGIPANQINGVPYTLKEDLVVPTGGITIADTTLAKGNTISGKNFTTGAGDTFAGGSTLAKGSTLATGTKLPKDSLNPQIYGRVDGQNIAYEVGTNNTIDVNTLGMDSILNEILLNMEEIYFAVNDANANPDTDSKEDLAKMFNEKLGDFDKILSQVSEKTADLGSRMARIEYVATRLTDEKTTFKELLSTTEDIDVEEVYVAFNTQYAVYQSALQATAKVITNTLADYL